MSKRFYFDENGIVRDKLRKNPEDYVHQRLEETRLLRYGSFVNHIAHLRYPESSILNTLRRQAFCVGSIATLDGLFSSKLEPTDKQHLHQSFLKTGVPHDLTGAEFKTNLEVTALSGLTAHPELVDIVDLVSRYFAETTSSYDFRAPVELGVGKTAYTLSILYDSMAKKDARYEFQREVNETDFDKVDWHRLIEDS